LTPKVFRYRAFNSRGADIAQVIYPGSSYRRSMIWMFDRVDNLTSHMYNPVNFRKKVSAADGRQRLNSLTLSGRFSWPSDEFPDSLAPLRNFPGIFLRRLLVFPQCPRQCELLPAASSLQPCFLRW
jgi:hypothetical protein